MTARQHTWWWVPVLAVALCVSGARAAELAATPKDPRELVLARSDLPAGAKPVANETGAAAALGFIYVQSAKALFKPSRHYAIEYRLPTRQVYSAAFVFGSPAVANAALTALSRALDVTNRRVRLPRLGDAQVTTYVIADALQHRFMVRRGNVVWRLDVVDWDAESRANSRAEAFALARKQQARVG